MIDSLIEEVSEICKELEWHFHTYDDKDIKGISFAPEKSEPVFLTFNPDGVLLAATNLMFQDIYDDIRISKDLLFTAITKTQYAGMDTHIAIIKLLKYISNKYLETFNLSDEGNYWETGDKQELEIQFKRYNTLINFVANTLNDFSTKKDETPASLADRIEKYLNEVMNKKRIG